MNSMFVRVVCRILAVCLAVAPFQAGAGLVSTGEAVTATASSAPAARAALIGQIEALGVAPDMARDRVASLSDAEVARLAGQLDSLPAGGSVPGLTIGVLVVVVFLIWRFGVRDQQAAAATPKEPAKKQ